MSIMWHANASPISRHSCRHHLQLHMDCCNCPVIRQMLMFDRWWIRFTFHFYILRGNCSMMMQHEGVSSIVSVLDDGSIFNRTFNAAIVPRLSPIFRHACLTPFSRIAFLSGRWSRDMTGRRLRRSSASSMAIPLFETALCAVIIP